MSEEKREPVIIHFALDTQYDARGRHAYFEAPSDWHDMSPEERQKFLDEELATWHAEEVEASATVYEGHKAAIEATKHSWGNQYSDDQLEQRW